MILVPAYFAINFVWYRILRKFTGGTAVDGFCTGFALILIESVDYLAAFALRFTPVPQFPASEHVALGALALEVLFSNTIIAFFANC